MGNALGKLYKDFTGITRLERELAEKDQLLDGSFYSPANFVLFLGDDALRETPTIGDFNGIRREQEHKFYAEAIAAARSFRQTDTRVVDERNDRHFYESRPSTIVHSSMQTNDQDSATAISRKRKLETVAIGGRKKSKAAEIAHLVPHNFFCANLYLQLIKQMTGIRLNDRTTRYDRLKLMALVHGVLEKNLKGEWSRVHNTGVKHNRTNMARVFAQKYFFNTWPKLLVLPIKEISKVLEYDGGPYEAIVIAADDEVYSSCRVDMKLELADCDDIRTAVDTLKLFVKASAYVMTNEDNESDINALSSREKMLIEEGLQDIRDNGGKVRVPELRFSSQDEMDTQGIRIGKVRFDMSNDSAHPESDPFAFFLKAVAVESYMQGKKILPGCSPIHECEICLEEEYAQCQCSFYEPDEGNGDPFATIPSEVVVRKGDNETSDEVSVCSKT